MATFVEFISSLHSCKQQAIVWHHQTNSYSAHAGALSSFYGEIVDLIDGLVESVSGIYGRPTGYDTHDLVDWTSVEDAIAYFKNVYTYIQTEREGLYKESWIQNQIDEIAELTASTIYKLTLK